MYEVIQTYFWHFLIYHFVFALIGLSTRLINTRYLRVSNLLWALLFGVVYMLVQFSDLDNIVIDLRARDKK